MYLTGIMQMDAVLLISMSAMAFVCRIHRITVEKGSVGRKAAEKQSA